MNLRRSLLACILAAALVPAFWAMAQKADLLYRQADKLIVQTPADEIVVTDKAVFKVFLQNTMDRAVPDITLVGQSKAFTMAIAPAEVSLPKEQRTYFDISLAPRPGTKPGSQQIQFRLLSERRLIKEFAVTVTVEPPPELPEPAPPTSSPPPEGTKPRPLRPEAALSRPEGPDGAGPLIPDEAPPGAGSRPAPVPPPEGARPRPASGAAATPASSPAPAVPPPPAPAAPPPKPEPPAFDESQHLMARPAAATPQVDGKLNEPSWKSGAALTGFATPAGGAPAFATTGLLTHDRNGLYLGLYCADEDAAALTDQDTVEILLTRMANARPAFRLTLSPTGRVQWKRILANGKEAAWAVSGIQFATDTTDHAWSLELAVPFEAMGMRPPAAPERWYLRVTRTKASGKTETSVWAPAAPAGRPATPGLGEIILTPIAQPQPAPAPKPAPKPTPAPAPEPELAPAPDPADAP